MKNLLDLPLTELTARARELRTSTRITYSPKVFVPLTRLCRDRCGYCTFATAPAHLPSPYLSPDEVLAIARAGAEAGCHEALFTLGEQPEERYPAARSWLSEHGYGSTVEYVRAMCALVLAETGLLPHANAGALSRAELAALREVAPSQGMMIESLRPDLAAHRGAPDKDPARRLATLEAAGELAIPFTTGILVGIGESPADRLDALLAIAASHRRHGHVQEVIVQNFLPKPGTGMRSWPPCPVDEHLQAVALARVVLPADVHVQAPPNLAGGGGRGSIAASASERGADGGREPTISAGGGGRGSIAASASERGADGGREPTIRPEPADLVRLLDAGIDDWGGVSPVTADHVNPERPWPAVDVLRAVCESRGLTLAPRLTVYPEYALAPARWLDETVAFPVLDRSDAEGLGRDDPGATWPERHAAAANVGTGAEVVQVGRRSTAWYSGADATPQVLVPEWDAVSAAYPTDRRVPPAVAAAAPAGPAARAELSREPVARERHSRAGRRDGTGGVVRPGVQSKGSVHEVLDGVRAGQEPGLDELVTLFSARGPEVRAVAALADDLRAEAVGDTVTYVENRNINYTNVCTYKCTFCGFSKGPLSLNLRGKPYLLTLDDVAARAREAWERGATEVCLQGGIHPSFDGNFYVDVTRAVRDAVPDMHIHGFTALEVTEGARRLGEPLGSYLQRLREAGLASLPGTAAEILDDEIRAVLCPDKINTEEWLEAHRVAHSIGLRSNITIMFGSVEQPVHWARHLVRTRELQRETGGFTEFVGLPFVHMAAPIYLKRGARRGPTWREVVLMHAVARIAYRGLVDNVQASWVKLGAVGSGQLLRAGVNDLGGTLMDENISRAAGAAHGQALDADGFAQIAASAGRRLEQRSTLYGRVPAVA